jgi:hypothetical protein
LCGLDDVAPEHALRARIEAQSIEADIETAFALVDMAEGESERNNFALAAEVVANAEEVRRELDLARLHSSGTSH